MSSRTTDHNNAIDRRNFEDVQTDLAPIETVETGPHAEFPPLIASEVRAATWNEFDLGGFQLSKKTLPIQLRKIEIAFYGLFLGITIVNAFLILAIQDIRVEGRLLHDLVHSALSIYEITFYVYACLVFFAYQRYRQKFLEKILGEIRPANPVFQVIFEAEGFEYGRDVGNLVLEKNWIYFEGERTTFALGGGQFAVEKKRKRYSSPRFSLLPWSTGGRLKIHMDLLVSPDKEYSFTKEFESWMEESRLVKGISVLPPLIPSERKEFSRSQELLHSLGVGVAVMLWVLASSMIVLLHWKGPLGLIAAITAISSFSLGYGLHRITVKKRRTLAFERLTTLQVKYPSQ